MLFLANRPDPIFRLEMGLDGYTGRDHVRYFLPFAAISFKEQNQVFTAELETEPLTWFTYVQMKGSSVTDTIIFKYEWESLAG